MNFAVYSLMRPRFTFLSSMTQFSFSSSMPFLSTMKPPLSLNVMTLPPSSMTFWVAYCATLPEPDTSTFLPSKLSPRDFSISSAKYTAP